jgi:hypothetical protein
MNWKRMTALVATATALALALKMAADIPISGRITTSGPGDTYPTHDSEFGRGGLLNTTNHANIPGGRMRVGMIAADWDGTNSTFWVLGTDTNTWTQIYPTTLPTLSLVPYSALSTNVFATNAGAGTFGLNPARTDVIGTLFATNAAVPSGGTLTLSPLSGPAALAIDGSHHVVTSASSKQQLDWLSTVTNDVQVQINAHSAAISGLLTNDLADNGLTSRTIAANFQAVPMTPGTYSTYYSAVCRTLHTNSSTINGLQLVYSTLAGNYGVNATFGGEGPLSGAAPFELWSAIEWPAGNTNLLFVTYGGRQLRLLRPGDVATSDPIAGYFPSGSVIAVRTFINRQASTSYTLNNGEPGLIASDQSTLTINYPAARGSTWSTGEGVKFINTNAANPYSALQSYMYGSASIPASDNQVFRPMVLGYTQQRYANGRVVIGDSWTVGTGDGYGNDLYGGLGYVQSWLGYTNVLNLGEGGERVSHWFGLGGNTQYRAQWAALGKYVWFALGNNDLNQGTNAAQLEANMITAWYALAGQGLHVNCATIPPRSTSTDYWQTTGNQTASANNNFTTQRAIINPWLRAGAAIYVNNGVAYATNAGATGAITAGQSGHPLTQVIDICPGVESAQDSGLWKAAAANLYSGTSTASTTTTTLYDSGKSFPVTSGVYSGGLAGYTLINTTHAGASVILSSTATTVTLVSAITGQTSGDSYVIRDVATADGVHPTPTCHRYLATNTLASATLR